ncbi:KAP family P-loop NTPase fold protein [Brucella intermedia]|uniref:KAP family P-loop NTPase fold protein n=1 Tax=Brucella intermedia TaxID=94625 RepID=UPI0007C6E59B|nr:P-loop NTPase fold protein [Brucella intermedia]OAE39709.1 hypothetical protein A7J42_14480 [Brucella intermedia]
MRGKRNIWEGDQLNREPHAAFLQKFLTERTLRKAKENGGSYVLNIDAEWGLGKSFFLDRFAQQLSLSGHAVVQINAWKDDYTDDPFVAVLAAIDQVIAPYLDKKGNVASAWDTAKNVAAPIAIKTAAGIGKTLFKKYVGEELKTIIDDTIQNADINAAANQAVEAGIAGIDKLADGFTEKIIAEFNEQNQAISDFRSNLEKAIQLLDGRATLPLYILIDELDRCRPSYAVSLLERVKHLFDASNICFIFATNNSQLQHAITGAYGPSFDGYRYLKRFFERTYSLPAPEQDDFAAALIQRINLDVFHAPRDRKDEFIRSTCRQYKMDLREIQQFMDIIETVSILWNREYRIELVTLAPLIIQYMRTGECDWAETEKSIPPGFSIDVGFNRGHGNIPLGVKACFTSLSRHYRSLSGVLEIRRNEHHVIDVTSTYVLRSLNDEAEEAAWNGESVQLGIPTLIQSAGNFT